MTADESHQRLGSNEFRDVIGHFASGVTIITATDGGQPVGTTASAVSSLSLEPPMLLACMNKASATGQAISVNGRFAVNILSERQAALAQRFATKAPDKFDGIAWVPSPAGMPFLDDALAHIDCRVTEATTGGTHSVFIAEVDVAAAHAGAPLAYFRGKFHRMHPHEG
jgi:flavin reductase (DIM6/NTAB) family NADH-FMN oxidoreductase RutF